MGLNIKSFSDFVKLIQGKFFKEIPEIDPTIEASFAKASSISTAAAAFSNQEGIVDGVRQSFWPTSDDEFLELTGSYDDVFRFSPQQALGFGVATGILGTIVPQDTPAIFTGNTYLVTIDSIVQSYIGSLSLSFSAGIVTAVTDLEHTLASGLSLDITGATQPEYNGTFIITVLDQNTFTYELTAGSLTTDNGSYSAEYALIELESVNKGFDQNVDPGGQLSINLLGLDGVVYVGDDGISGGLNQESLEAFRERVGESHNNTPGIATPPSLKFSAKSIPGNTRVFIVRPDNTSGGTPGVAGYKPELGETVIYLLRDNDPSIIPSASVLAETKQQILNDGLWPSFILDQYLYVLAPILKTQDFIFTSITPNTVTMQNAIDNQLEAFFEDNAEIGGTITLDTINSFLRQVQDTTTGLFLTDFTYTTPASAIIAGSGEIYTKGTVSF